MASSAKPAVQPIPAGTSTLTPHLVCAGGAAALDFYKKAFGATEEMRLAAPDGTLLHGSLRIGDSRLMICDEVPGCNAFSPKALKGSPVTIHYAVVDVDAAFQRAIAAGCTPVMPPQDMFWGDRYGVVTDPFGHHWSIATHIKDLTPEELERAAAEAMAHCA